MVGMKRTIFVRPLSDAEREALEDGLRSYDAFVLRRCQILFASARGENAYQIAHSLGYGPQAARTAIKRFNEGGLREALHERSSRPMMWRLRSVICLTPSYPRGPLFRCLHALGVDYGRARSGPRPSAFLGCSRSASWAFRQVPSRRQRRW